MCVLTLSIALAKPLLAGNSISGIATCKVPFILEMPDGSKLVAEELIEEQDTNITNNDKNDVSLNAEEEPNCIIQQEETVSEDSKEIKLINTVCAR